MNKVFLIGNLTHDPESGCTQSGVAFCRFSLAVNRRFSKENNETDFFNITCWRGLAETCAKLLEKGKKVCVSGSIQIRSYEKDGIKRQAVDIVADEVEFLSPVVNKNEEDGQVSDEKQASVSNLTPVEEELPF